MKSVVLPTLYLLVMIAALPAQDQKVLFHEQVNLESGSSRGYVELQVKDSVLVLGKRFTVQIVFHNTGGGAYFYNPFFIGLIDLPAQLAIFDSKKEYIGNLLYWEGGSRRSTGKDDWTFIWGGFVGTNIERTAGYVPGTQYGSTSRLLPPGVYYLQVIYYGVFLHPHYELKNELDRDDWAKFDKKELFRSNVVKVELVN